MVPRSEVGSNSSRSGNEVIKPGSTSWKINTQRTPFTKGRLPLNELKRGTHNTNALDVLQDLLRQSWSAYSVSPLFTWSSRETKLKRYCRRVVTFLAETLPIDDGDTFEVDYQIKPGLKFNANDDPAVKITVEMHYDDSARQVFVGYLLSWGFSSKAKCTELDGVLYLPVLLCTGGKRVTTQVCRALENIHDCVISPVDLTETDRKDLWFALLSYLQIEGETIAISYKIPQQPSVGSIELTISSNITTKLCRLIHQKYGRNITDEVVALFWSEISDYVADIYEVKLQKCEMVKLQTRQAVITSNKFRVSSVKAMHAILLLLTDRSVKLDSPTS